MPKKDIVKIVTEIAEPIALRYGVELVEVEFKKEGNDWFLRLFIDKESGVDLNDCQRVSEDVSEALDRLDPIDVSYFLEVSSPGIDRPLKTLKDFERFRGEIVDVSTFVPIEGSKKFSGKLLGLEGDILVLEVKGKELRIPYEKVSACRLAVIF